MVDAGAAEPSHMVRRRHLRRVATETSPSATGRRRVRRHLRRVTALNIAICDGSADYHHSLSSLDSIERRWSREQRSQK